MENILFWISVFSGGLMLALLLFSLVGGLDMEMDVDAETDTDGGGGLGYLKGILTFISMSAWVMRILLIANKSKTVSILGGIIVGSITVFLLSKLLQFLISKQQFNTWKIEDAVHSSGSVYLKIPVNGEGIVKVKINDAMQELKATTNDKEDIPTGASVYIEDIENNKLVVTQKIPNNQYF